MPRRRRSEESLDSLDLLLDTICNTFGGVLFMAMLVSLLSGRRVETPPDAEAAARQALASLSAIESREKTLAESQQRADAAGIERHAAEAQVDRVAQTLGWPASRADRVVRSLATQQAAINDALNTRKILADLTSEAVAKSAALAAAQAELNQRRSEIAVAARAAEQARRTRDGIALRLPTAHETTKRQAVAFVSGGRLYAGIYPAERFRSSGRLFRGTTVGGDGQSIRPADLPDRLGSRPIDSGMTAKAALGEQGIGTLDSDADYVMFAVWPDSHEAFRRLREETTRQGIGYGLILMDSNEAVSFGGGRGYEQ